MSVIRPFRAIRYAGVKNLDLSKRISPPYDILSEADKRAFLQRDPRSFVALDLPYTPPKEAGPPEVYQAAGRMMEAWLEDGTLVKDEKPALYAYHQRYRHGDVEYTRRMFFARLKLEPFGEGSIFPHEQTFGGPKQDRLALTRATRANLSPIFGLYEDRDNDVSAVLGGALSADPLAQGTLDGVKNRLWAVTDKNVIARVRTMMASKPIYIADGHHRYGTALLYRDEVAAKRGALPADDPVNFVLCVLCAMEDPGLLIQPTHRVLPEAGGVTTAVFEGDAKLRVQPLEAKSADEAVAGLASFGPQAIGFWNGRERKYAAITPVDGDILRPVEPERSAAWRGLGVAFLHRYLIDRVAAGVAPGAPAKITYIKSAVEAVGAADQSGGAAFLLQPTTMEELRAVCKAGDLMPQKSTYFYPKLASGLVISPLTD